MLRTPWYWRPEEVRRKWQLALRCPAKTVISGATVWCEIADQCASHVVHQHDDVSWTDIDTLASDP
jgi:hypothetical protein